MKATHAAVWLAAALTGLPAGAHDSGSQALVPQQLRAARAEDNFYKAYFPDPATGRKAAISFHAQMMEARYADGYLVMQLSARDMDRLAAFGFRFERASEFAQQRAEFLARMEGLAQQRLQGGSTAVSRENGIASIPNFSCYETVEETFAAAQGFTTTHPHLAEWIDIGNSWQKTAGLGGWDMFVLKLTNKNTGGDKPRLFIQSAIHAREYVTAPLNLSFARWLLEGYGSNADATWILDHQEVHLLLHTNPDGRKMAEAGQLWRKNTNRAYCGATSSSRGADLNRNFTFQWNSTGGEGSSGDPCDETYRGPAPASEPEIQAVEAYARSLWPDRRGPGDNDAAPDDTSGIHLDLHSYSELVLWPWGATAAPAPNGTALQTLGRRFAFFNNYTPTQSIGLYPTDGTSDGISYGELGVAAYTFELGTSFFQNCTTYNNTIKPDNLPALIYAAKVTRAPYLTPAGPDVLALALVGGASTTGVPAGTPVAVTGQVTDARFNDSNGTESTQAIAAVEYTIDVPPWEAGATPRPLGAADGAFNETSEDLTGTLDTVGLAPGRHIVYVRGRDAAGSTGPVSAAFLVINEGGPQPLDANFTFACSLLACNFDAASSTGAPTTFNWTFGDGSSGSGTAVAHTYAAAGTYSVTLTVGDGSRTSSETRSVSVTDRTALAEAEPNNSRATAQPVAPNPALVNGTMANATDNDYFRVVIAPGRTLTSTLRPNSSSDYDLHVYNSSGGLLASSTRGTGQADVVSVRNRSASAATVYVRVRYWSGGTGASAGSYTLDLAQ